MVRNTKMSDKTAVYRDSKGNILKVGSVVQTVSGRDRKRVFTIVAIESGNKNAPIIIANGTLRTLEDRKHKNPMHLRLIGVLEDSDIIKLNNNPSDLLIADMCAKFDEKMSEKL